MLSEKERNIIDSFKHYTKVRISEEKKVRQNEIIAGLKKLYGDEIINILLAYARFDEDNVWCISLPKHALITARLKGDKYSFNIIGKSRIFSSIEDLTEALV